MFEKQSDEAVEYARETIALETEFLLCQLYIG
jgi:hypothetical protein